MRTKQRRPMTPASRRIETEADQRMDTVGGTHVGGEFMRRLRCIGSHRHAVSGANLEHGGQLHHAPAWLWRDPGEQEARQPTDRNHESVPAFGKNNCWPLMR